MVAFKKIGTCICIYKYQKQFRHDALNGNSKLLNKPYNSKVYLSRISFNDINEHLSDNQ